MSEIPFVGDFERNAAEDDVVTMDQRRAFEALARAFSGRSFRRVDFVGGRPVDPEADLHAELRLARAGYDPSTSQSSETVVLRLWSPAGVVVYQTAGVGVAEGDPRSDPALLNLALERAFIDLATKVARDSGKILADLQFSATDLAALEERILRRSRQLGRSSRRDTDRGRRYAVLIGVGDYANERVVDLAAPATDARRLFGVLNDPANRLAYSSDSVALLLDEDADLRTIRNTLSRWLAAKVTPEDTVVVFFAGHGVYDESLTRVTQRQEKYFLPVDFDPGDMTFASALPMDELISYFRVLPARNIVMVLDACKAGAAIPADADDLDRFTRARRPEGGLSAVLAAASPDQAAFETGRGGVFTTHLLRGLQGEADGRQGTADGVVTVLEAAAFTEDAVASELEAAGKVQRPLFRANDDRAAAELGLVALE